MTRTQLLMRMLLAHDGSLSLVEKAPKIAWS